MYNQVMSRQGSMKHERTFWDKGCGSSFEPSAGAIARGSGASRLTRDFSLLSIGAFLGALTSVRSNGLLGSGACRGTTNV